jgi:hypothetical protein
VAVVCRVGMGVRSERRLKRMLVASVLAVGLGLSAELPAWASADQASVSLGPLSTVGSPFGFPVGLQAAMGASGEVTLVWGGPFVSEAGLADGIDSVRIGPTGAQAAPVVVAGGRFAFSHPALGLAPSGRAAVAWFEERPTSNQYSNEIPALQVRDLLPGAGMQAPRTVWRPAPVFRGRAMGLAVATDAAGDEVLAWLTRTPQADRQELAVMVSSRRANGVFTAPVKLTRDDPEVAPAVAMSSSGEATVVWPGPDAQQVLASTWAAGAQPTPATVLDRYTPAGAYATFERFRDLQIANEPSGGELITWLYGLPSTEGRPHVVTLDASWHLPGAGFGPTQTVSPPGAEAREQAAALAVDGRALIAWGEITSTGQGPTLNYATAFRGGAFDPGTAVGSPVVGTFGSQTGEEPELAAAWLPDGSALMSWLDNRTLLAAHWTPGGAFPPPTVVTHLGEFDGAVMAAGGSSDPLFAWVASSLLDASSTLDADQVRYVTASQLDGPAHPIVAPVLALTGSASLEREHGLRILARCSERCRLTASARMFIRTGHNTTTGAETREHLGAFPPLQRVLSGGQTTSLRLQITPSLMRTYCRAQRRHEVSIEVRLAALGLRSAVNQTVTLGDFPAGGACPR